MFCKYCGAEIPEQAKFCPNCGAAAASEKPQKRSKKPPEQIKPPPFLIRIILVLCSLILFCVSTATLFVNFIGKDAEAVILSASMNKRLPNEKYLYSWDVTYEFYVGGKKYTDTDELIGSRDSVNTFGYHVSYLSFAPEVSRLTRGDSVSDGTSLFDMLKMGSGAIFCFLLEAFVSYFLLWTAFPKLPFFGFGKGRRKKIE